MDSERKKNELINTENIWVVAREVRGGVRVKCVKMVKMYRLPGIR